jgi:hypothetical protein
MKILLVGAELLDGDERIDMAKLIVTFCNFTTYLKTCGIGIYPEDLRKLHFPHNLLYCDTWMQIVTALKN